MWNGPHGSKTSAIKIPLQWPDGWGVLVAVFRRTDRAASPSQFGKALARHKRFFSGSANRRGALTQEEAGGVICEVSG
jgi:hypothetical protein